MKNVLVGGVFLAMVGVASATTLTGVGLAPSSLNGAGSLADDGAGGISVTLNLGVAGGTAVLTPTSQDNRVSADLLLSSTDEVELGLCLRATYPADGYTTHAYVATFDPASKEFKIALVGDGLIFSDLATWTHDKLSYAKLYHLDFQIVGDHLDAWLSEDDVEIKHLSAVDATYTTGQLGVFLYKDGYSSTRVGSWRNASYEAVPEPVTMALLAMGGVLLLRRKRTLMR